MKFFATSQLSERISETPEGYLICLDVPIARTGEMVYAAGETPIPPDASGKVIVTRDAAEVFRPETIASFQGKSFTIYHPNDFVDPKNWKTLTCGIIQNVRRGTGANESDLMADILITDADAIAKVKAGVREVSCGYDAEYIETGIGRGIQKGIIGNHVALVDEGRAGQSYAINDHSAAAHKGKGIKMTFMEKLKALVSEAEEKPAKGKTKDGEMSAYDKMCGMMKDMGTLLESMKPQDASTAPTQAAPAEVVAKDEEKPVEVKAKDAEEEEKKKKQDARDAFIDAMMEKAAKDAEGEKKDDEEESEEKEESEDAEPSEGGAVGSEDDMEEESEMTGDAASRIEILAPGLKAKGKDAKVKALEACYATTDGKELIHRFTDGKALDSKNEALVNSVFIGVSEILKSERKKAFGSSKTFDIQKSSLTTPKSGGLSAEDINKKNAAFYAAK